MKKIIYILLILIGVSLFKAHGQNVAIKTNLLHGATFSPNASVEIGFSGKNTLDLYGGYKWFDNPTDNSTWRHYIIQPGVRWWFCERFNGGFVGFHLHGGEFNIGGVKSIKWLKNDRYEGVFYGAGVSYGYQWILSNRWGLELEAGVGYARIEYDKYACHRCSPKTGSGHLNYFGPTKLNVSISFLLW